MLKALIVCSSMILYSWLSYVDKTNGYSISYPLEWTKRDLATGIAFLSPKENMGDVFQENINVVIEEVSSKTDLEAYTQKTKSTIVKTFGEKAIISLRDVRLSGQQAKELIYFFTYQSSNLKIKQYYLIKSNKAYVVTYTGEVTNYERYLKTATESMDSFKFL